MSHSSAGVFVVVPTVTAGCGWADMRNRANNNAESAVDAHKLIKLGKVITKLSSAFEFPTVCALDSSHILRVARVDDIQYVAFSTEMIKCDTVRQFNASVIARFVSSF